MSSIGCAAGRVVPLPEPVEFGSSRVSADCVDRLDGIGVKRLGAAVIRIGPVSRRFGSLLDTGPQQLPTSPTDWVGQDDAGTWNVVAVATRTGRSAVVVRQGPDRFSAGRRPAHPLQPLQQFAVVSAGQDDLDRLHAWLGAVAIDLDTSVDCRRPWMNGPIPTATLRTRID